ncbi:MAG TPA: hypothetical protein VLK56_05070 [Solirubrobacterales bacterium]|nr:hypothetical protein [Solirubrobacterales bacterium]
MTVATATAQKWTCARCGVSTSQIDGGRIPLPDSWVTSDDGLFCLTCRRERAGEAALEAAPDDCSNDVRAKVRRSGLLEFEVRRAPDRADNAIAKACHTSASAVAAARRELQPQAKVPARR